VSHDLSPTDLSAIDVLARALDARDARFDGLFFVGITTTRIYCRPVCPARISDTRNRRFFASAAAAERAGFRPCLRCRPELAPGGGRAQMDAVPRLAQAAEHRIAAGALNGGSVAELARELGVSPRHLRRALERELGVSPVELAQTHRLLLAKRLLADTPLPVTRVAYASGFQSLRRFNAAFRERYRMAPSAIRRTPHRRAAARGGPGVPNDEPAEGWLRLTLAYRAPLAWDALVAVLAREAIPGVECVCGRVYGRTLRLDGHAGAVLVTDAPNATHSHIRIDVSPARVPALMPLLARLRRLLDLDAVPSAIDAHLAHVGPERLASLVARRPGLRLPGAADGFEAALRALLGPRAGCVAQALGTPVDAGVPALSTVAPDAGRVADAGADRLAALGVPRRAAHALAAVARGVADGTLRLDPPADAAAVRRALRAAGVGDATATTIVARALSWPDAFCATDRALQRAAGVEGARALGTLAERWRPWRAYAALHLRLAERSVAELR